MKKVSTLCFILFIIQSSWFAQTKNYATHTGAESSSEMVGIGGCTFYAITIVPIKQTCKGSMYFVGNNLFGKEMFRILLTSGDWPANPRLFVTNDQHVIVSGGSRTEACDIGSADFDVKKFDTLGNVIWQLNVPYEVVDLIKMPDSTFYVVTPDKLYRCDNNGIFISSFDVANFNIQRACFFSPNKIFLSGFDQSGFKCKLVDTLGAFLSESPFAGPTKLYSGKMKSSYALDKATVLQLNENGIVLNKISIGSTSFESLSISNDSLFICGRDSGSHPFYMITDLQLQVLFTSSGNIENASVTGIYRGLNNKINLALTAFAGKSPSNSYSDFMQTDAFGPVNAASDIGVTGFTVVGGPVYGMYNGSGIRATLNAVVTVKNFGLDTVRSFVLNHYGYASGFYFWLTGLNKSYSISISPGGSITVPTGTFFTSPFLQSMPSYWQTYTLDVCINTSVPNASPDIDVTNDFLCNTITALPVSTREEDRQDAGISIFPNPASNQMSIHAAEKITVV